MSLDSNDPGFRNRVIRAGMWNSVGRVATEGSRYVIAIVLARLLSPAEFGLIALATALMTLIHAFADLRIGYGLIQKPDVSEEQWSSAFWLCTGIGVVLTIAFAAAAPLVASFYENPVLVPIVWVLALNFLLSALILIPKTQLEKALRFKALAAAQLVVVVVTGAVAIVMALAGFGVWSLVVQSTGATLIEMVLVFAYARWRPALTLHWASLRPLLSFSGPLILGDVINTLVASADRLILGKMVTPSALGLYSRAKTFLYLPVGNLSFTLCRVMFPSLSALQEDPERLKRATLKMLKLLAVVSFPLMAVMAVAAEPLVQVVLGPKWLAAVPLMQVFALAGLPASFNAVSSTIFLSQGKIDLFFRLNLLRQLVSLGFVFAGSFWGAMGCSLGVACSAIVIFAVDARFIGRHIGVSLGVYLAQLVPTLLTAAATALWVFLVGQLLGPQQDLLRVASLVSAGPVYMVALAFLDRQGLDLVRQTIRHSGFLPQGVRAATARLLGSEVG